MKPLEGLLVLEFCQYLAGPSAGLRLADLGARVIKIERPGKGEGGRGIAIKNLFVEGNSLVFNTINRNKESYAANLKDPEDLALVKKLIEQADVMTHNFRPGVMEKIGLDYDTVAAMNDRLIYAEVTGYGTKGPWMAKPGQDLLVQSMSGLVNLTGTKTDGPTPFGLAVADLLCGAHLCQGIMASLVRRGKTNKGGRIEVSLLESMLDFQFEVITTHLNDGKKLPERAKAGSGHAYLSAPYGVYKTKDAYLSIAMGDLMVLADAVDCDALKEFTYPKSWFDKRDEIMDILRDVLVADTTAAWLVKLETAGIWCSEVLTYDELLDHEAYKVLGMDQKVKCSGGSTVHTTRCPIRIDGERFYSEKAAPQVGEDNETIAKDLL